MTIMVVYQMTTLFLLPVNQISFESIPDDFKDNLISFNLMTNIYIDILDSYLVKTI